MNRLSPLDSAHMYRRQGNHLKLDIPYESSSLEEEPSVSDSIL